MFNLPIVTDLMGCISSIEYIKSFESCEEEKTHKLSTDIATVETGSYENERLRDYKHQLFRHLFDLYLMRLIITDHLQCTHVIFPILDHICIA